MAAVHPPSPAPPPPQRVGLSTAVAASPRSRCAGWLPSSAGARTMELCFEAARTGLARLKTAQVGEGLLRQAVGLAVTAQVPTMPCHAPWGQPHGGQRGHETHRVQDGRGLPVGSMGNVSTTSLV